MPTRRSWRQLVFRGFLTWPSPAPDRHSPAKPCGALSPSLQAALWEIFQPIYNGQGHLQQVTVPVGS